MPAKAFYLPLAALLLLPCAACAPMLPAALPDPDVDLGLGDVVLLTWTTRSPDGILGYAMLQEGIGVDPHRRVVDGNARWVETSQKMRFLFTRQRAIQGKVGTGAVGASAGIAQATHVAYDVHLTRYLELPPDSLRYAAASGCCFGGEASASCGNWYVIRMMWGSGRVQYLQQVSADASLSGGEFLRAQGGTTYRRLNEMAFDQAFFAYEAVPVEDLCSTLHPEEELSTMTVRAPKNCWALAQRRDGTSAADAWHLTDEKSCQEVARKHCGAAQDVMSCGMTFGTGDEAHRTAIPLDELTHSPEPTGAPSSPTRSPATSDSW